jgi:thioester reductase-like protein
MATNLRDCSILMTGFPGFLSDHLIRVLARETTGPLELLCLPTMTEVARLRMEHLEVSFPGLRERWRVRAGDITRERLGLSEAVYGELLETVGVVWHLAAIYDLAVSRAAAYEVNVGGTARVLDFCESAVELRRLNYVSTSYVSGDRTGVILEEELDRGQGHKNYYEETKFWAEVEVQRRSAEEGLRTVIFRPGIVVGDSRTGEVGKYDGPYYVFRLLHRLAEWVPFPNVGRGDAAVNLIPVDFVAEALSALGHREGYEGEVFHLADPQPMVAQQIVDAVLRQLGRSPTVGRLPSTWVERALANRLVKGWTEVPAEALVYFNHDARYDTTRSTAALSELGLSCPPLPTYLETLVDYYLLHPERPPGPGVV